MAWAQEVAMQPWTRATMGLLAIGPLIASLGGCVAYHQEVAALRMPRPSAEAPGLAGYAAADPRYPSVGGDILKGASPTSAAIYDATSGDRVPPPDAR
jgi:hypothetical protein